MDVQHLLHYTCQMIPDIEIHSTTTYFAQVWSYEGNGYWEVACSSGETPEKALERLCSRDMAHVTGFQP